ncbi:MAG: ABC transporter ATP-binding protein [Pseudomonadales bacterium]|nr:ABC transporter ATP-binding protein [Pseudomonadales bacterium]
MSLPGLKQIRNLWPDIHWAFGKARDACPRLFTLFWVNAATSMLYPAGIALSVRGLVNAVSAGLESGSLNSTTVYLWLLLGLVMSLGTAISNAATRHLANRFQLELRLRLSEEFMRKNLTVPYASFEGQDYRDKLTRASNVPEAHITLLYVTTMELLTKAAQVLSLCVILLAIEPLLFILLLPIGIPYLYFQWRMSRRGFEELDSRVRQDRWLRYYRSLSSNLEQGAEIRLLGIGPELIRRAGEIMASFHALITRTQNLEFIGIAVFSVLSVCAVYIALGKAAFAIVEGGLTIGDLAIYGSAAAQMRTMVDQSMQLLGRVRMQYMHVQRLRQFLEADFDRPDTGTAAVPVLAGDIRFDNVCFAYPESDAAILNGLSLHIAAGETVALVGRNGAGKSTVAKLLAGFYRPDSGSISIDGHDISEFDPQAYSRAISLVPQHFGRYAASAADNIAFGQWNELEGSREAIEAIGKAAGVDDMIRKLPAGYDTVLGREFGELNLSGGQWQHLAIARMMARTAPILIMDEPTASLDVEAEFELFQRLRALARGTTTLLISHRFTTVSMADKILVMDGGKIVEAGTHRELLEQSGQYANMYDLARKNFPTA